MQSALTFTAITAAVLMSSHALAQSAQQHETLDEVVVTANKRIQNVQEVASSVSVESGDKLVERGQSQLADYAAYMPGFNVTNLGAPGLTSVSLRGISTGAATSAVGTYLDDTPMGGSSAWANSATTLLDMLPYDLDRLEVLRGPQGTLYGAGSMGGLIKYVLKAPSTTDYQAKVGAELNTIDGAGRTGHAYLARVSAPVLDNVLGVSLSVFDKVTPGFMTNAYTGEQDTNRAQQYGARLAALWTPTSTVSVKFTGLTQTIEDDDIAVKQYANSVRLPNANGAVILQPTDPLPDLTENEAFESPYVQRLNYYAATVDWDAGLFNVVSATSWSSQRSSATENFTEALGPILPLIGGTAPGLARIDYDFGLDKFTQEFRLVSPTGKTFEWLAGVFVTHENSFNNQAGRAFNFNYTPMTSLAYPPGFFDAQLPELYDEYAAFGDATWNVTDQFSVSAGARYAHNDQNWNAVVAPGPLVNEIGLIHVGTHEGVATWMANAEYRFYKDTMTYARVATGYRPGGPNSPLAGIPPSVGADRLINYELGLKSTFLEHKAQVDAAVYRIDWTDIQLNATTNNLTYVANGGKAISQGVEFAGIYFPVSQLTLGLNAAYTDAHLTSVIPAASYLLTGYQLPDVPKESASLTVDYSVPLSSSWTGLVGGGYRYIGKEWLAAVESASPSTTPTVEAPAYSVVDLNGSARNEHLTIKAYVRNLANKRAIVGGASSGIGQGLTQTNAETGVSQVFATFIQPRTVGVGVDYTF
jgi:outer membrane receptor protein involved in Fe transport